MAVAPGTQQILRRVAECGSRYRTVTYTDPDHAKISELIDAGYIETVCEVADRRLVQLTGLGANALHPHTTHLA